VGYDSHLGLVEAAESSGIERFPGRTAPDGHACGQAQHLVAQAFLAVEGVGCQQETLRAGAGLPRPGVSSFHSPLTASARIGLVLAIVVMRATRMNRTNKKNLLSPLKGNTGVPLFGAP
jgi:hypothetical protein